MGLLSNSKLVHHLVAVGEHSFLFPALFGDRAKSKQYKNIVRWKINVNLCSNFFPKLLFLFEKKRKSSWP